MENMGTLYYTVREAKQRQIALSRSFERPVPQYSVLTELVLFFSDNASPQWTIFASSS